MKTNAFKQTLKSLLSLGLVYSGLLLLSKGGLILIIAAFIEVIDAFDPAANR